MPPFGSFTGSGSMSFNDSRARTHMEDNPSQLYAYWMSLLDGFDPREQQILRNQYNSLYGDYLANFRGGSSISPFREYLQGIDPQAIIDEEMAGLSPSQRGASDPRRFIGPARWITF